MKEKLVGTLIRVLKAEPVRLRLYSLAAVIGGYLVTRGYIDGVTLDLLLSVAAIVLAVETARSKVSPTGKRSATDE